MSSGEALQPDAPDRVAGDAAGSSTAPSSDLLEPPAGAGAWPGEALLEEVYQEASSAIESATSLEELDEALRSALGKRSTFAGLYQHLRELPAESRPRAGEHLLQLRRRVEDLAALHRGVLADSERKERLSADRLDLTEVLPEPLAGHLHLVTQVREELEDVFVGMGYEIAEGPEVESDLYNFEALNVGPDHPARSSGDTFFVQSQARGNLLLRTHTSPVQVRLLERGRLPIYAVAPGRVYRRDTPDATHLPVFHQIEGLVVDKDVTFGDLAGTIETFVHAIFGEAISSRLRPAYFPFTEPSAEFEITCMICSGSGCPTCKGIGWIELGGCGMVHPAVFRATGADPLAWTGFAFGFGIDRIAIMRHGIADLRSLVENDVRFLEQF